MSGMLGSPPVKVWISGLSSGLPGMTAAPNSSPTTQDCFASSQIQTTSLLLRVMTLIAAFLQQRQDLTLETHFGVEPAGRDSLQRNGEQCDSKNEHQFHAEQGLASTIPFVPC